MHLQLRNRLHGTPSCQTEGWYDDYGDDVQFLSLHPAFLSPPCRTYLLLLVFGVVDDRAERTRSQNVLTDVTEIA